MSIKSSDNDKVMNPQLQKRLATYATAAGVAVLSGLAASGPAQAAAVLSQDYRPAGIVHSALGLANGFGIDFDQDGDDEFSLVRTNAFAEAIYLDRETAGSDIGSSAVATSIGGYVYAKALSSAISIGPSRTDFSSNPIFYLGYSSYGQFPGAGDKFVGVRFRLDGNLTDYYYGWILLSVPIDSTSVTIKAYGYNDTPNAAIPTAVSLRSLSASSSSSSVAPVAAIISLATAVTGLFVWGRHRLGTLLRRNRS